MYWNFKYSNPSWENNTNIFWNHKEIERKKNMSSNKGILAGVGTAMAFDGVGNLIFKARALTDSGFNISTNSEEIRGGQGAALQGKYYHTTSFGVTLKDAVTDLNYFALQVGGTIKAGGDVFTTEEVKISEANKITVQGEPKEFGEYGIIGWYSYTNDDTATTITFKGKTANASGVKEGETVCVTYVETSDSARAFEVATAFIPSEVHLVFTMPLLNASAMKKTDTASQIGEYIIDVPRFQFNGSVDMSSTSTSSSSVDISGTALQAGTTGCSGKGYYATITENFYNKDAFDNVYAIVVEDSDVDLKEGESQTLRVMALYNDGTTPSVVDNAKLTFTVSSENSGQSYASVGANDGKVSATATGTAIVEIKVTEKPTLTASATVTVTGE